MQSVKKTQQVVVTGSNKGIGYAIVEALLRLSQDSNHSGSYKVAMTSRSIDKANQSAKELLTKYPSGEIDTFQLDLMSQKSYTEFSSKLLEKYGVHGVDVFVNNAGMFVIGKETKDNRKKEWKTNYVHTKALTNLVLESQILHPQGKVISTSSMMGKSSYIKRSNPEAFKQFENYKSMTMETLEALEDSMWKDHTSGTPFTRNRWASPFYCTTKMFLSTWTSVLGRYAGELFNYPDLQIYSFHPGWCRTDMTQPQQDRGMMPPNSKEQGAETAIYLITDPQFKKKNKLQGEYFADSAHDSMVY